MDKKLHLKMTLKKPPFSEGLKCYLQLLQNLTLIRNWANTKTATKSFSIVLYVKMLSRVVTLHGVTVATFYKCKQNLSSAFCNAFYWLIFCKEISLTESLMM